MITSLKVRGKRHRVRWNSRKIPKDRWGDYDADLLEIRIARAARDQQREVLLHELMHAIEEQYDIDITHDALAEMSRGLFAAMRENPGLHELIFGDTEWKRNTPGESRRSSSRGSSSSLSLSTSSQSPGSSEAPTPPKTNESSP